MARVTEADVRGIFPTTLSVMPFILTASELVTLYFATSGYSSTQMALLELYWSAHLASSTDPAVVAKTLGDTKIQYQSRKPGAGLQSTMYGECVLALDTAHILAAAAAAEEEAETVAVKYASFYMD